MAEGDQVTSALHERQVEPFVTTHWSVVLAAGAGSGAESKAALETLCQTYWLPLYAFVRRRGLDSHMAQDVVQGFFAQLLERQSFQDRTPDRGRFRSFLLASIQYYLADVTDRQRAAKRGGGDIPIPLDALQAEGWYRVQPVDDLTPEKIFERRWALTLLERVLARLENEFAASARPELFRQLRPSLFEAEPGGNYEDIAAALQMTPGAVRVAAHRIRQRCRELFREEVAQTVEHPSEIEEELRYLRRVMAG